MDSEATKTVIPPTPPTPQPQQKQSSGNGSRAAFAAAFAAAGVAAGAGAAMAGKMAYDTFVADEEPKPEQETAAAEAAAPKPEPNPEPNPEPKPESKPESKPVQEEQQEQQEQQEIVQQHDAPVKSQGPAQEVGDDEVRVVGVAVSDNDHGGVATIMGIQQGEDSALLVDFETDGRVDALIHDDNQNGTIEDNEIHDVSEDNIATAKVVEEYVADAHEQGNVAKVVNLNTGETFALEDTPQDGPTYANNSDEIVDSDYQNVMDEPAPEDIGSPYESSDMMDDPIADANDATFDI